MSELVLSLCGDVMTGRGIDQILPHPGDPELRESYAKSALQYVELAEAANGKLPRPVTFDYVWGDALTELWRTPPHVRIVNLETSITTSRKFWPKEVNYRMHPANVSCISAAGIDCCGLANNHVADFGYDGLADTIEALERARIGVAGAGRNAREAEAPAIRDVPSVGRVLVFCFGLTTSGIPEQWAAGTREPGLNVLADLSERAVGSIAARVRAVKRANDVVIASIHWGANWGYDIPPEHRDFARALIEAAEVDVIHGHSSHHAKAIEVYRGKLILYGCGDFLNDYEGIMERREFRDDLALLFLPTVDASNGRLKRLAMVPFQIKRFRLNRTSANDATWLCETLNREGKAYGTAFKLTPDGRIELDARNLGA